MTEHPIPASLNAAALIRCVKRLPTGAETPCKCEDADCAFERPLEFARVPDPIPAETLTEWREDFRRRIVVTDAERNARYAALIGEVERLSSALAEAERERDRAVKLRRAEQADRVLATRRKRQAESELAALREGVAGLADKWADLNYVHGGNYHEAHAYEDGRNNQAEQCSDQLRALLGDQESDR